MKPEDKELLLQDLCARLPYGIKAKANDITVVTINGIVKRQSLTGYFDYDIITDNGNFYLKEVKPYLRPLSSMTEEEQRELQSFFPCSFGNQYLDLDNEMIKLFECNSTMEVDLYDSVQMVDFCKKNHLDCYGLIKKGLALSTEDNNPYKD